jgi:regulatory protein
MKTKSKPEASELRKRALGLLARREHSRFEVARKLAQTGFDEADIAALLDEFEGKNWLSDRRFAESWVADHKTRSGRVKLAHELRQRGVDEKLIEAVLASHHDTEAERAREVWQKKFGVRPTDLAETAKQIRFLQGRGFSSSAIRQTLGNTTDADL